MKEIYQLNSAAERQSLGALQKDKEAGEIILTLTPQLRGKYQPALVSLIKRIEAEGGYGIKLSEDELRITGVNAGFWQSLIQSMILYLDIIPDKEDPSLK